LLQASNLLRYYGWMDIACNNSQAWGTRRADVCREGKGGGEGEAHDVSVQGRGGVVHNISVHGGRGGGGGHNTVSRVGGGGVTISVSREEETSRKSPASMVVKDVPRTGATLLTSWPSNRQGVM